ncbi:restriction endonuclease subunit S [Klebsiella michiganensis]|nr:restriction endonuclease subunit S [Klebsiella michiganensis]
MSGGKLPEGWVECELSALGHIVTGKTPSTKEPSNFGGDIPFIKPGDLDLGGYITATADTLTEKGLALVPTLPTNSIVVTCIGNLGKVGITTIRSASNQQINALIPSEKLNVKFIYYQILTLKPWLESQSAATTIAIVNKSKFSQAPFKFPPISEQKIIAEKLDTLLAQVDSTKARLEQIPQILKRFRQAVLATTMSGKLTNLPTANNFKIKDIACVIGGLTKNSKRNNFEKKVPYLRVANVYENELKLDDVTEIGIQPNELHRVSLEYEDLLIVEGNGSLDQIGRAAIWREEIQECVHQNHLIKVRANKEILYPTFLLFYFMSPQGKEEIVSRATSGAGLYTLSISKISSINVPVYSLPDQHEIVRRVEQLFAYADTIEKQVDSALARVNILTQSILAKAFRGELTAQWRAENPDLISGENSAAALLEKIKAERTASGSKKTTRKKA